MPTTEAWIKALLLELKLKGKKDGAQVIAELRRLGYEGPEVAAKSQASTPQAPVETRAEGADA